MLIVLVDWDHDFRIMHVWFVANLSQAEKKIGTAKIFVICLVYVKKIALQNYLAELNMSRCNFGGKPNKH
jgi:hypothetical protein